MLCVTTATPFTETAAVAAIQTVLLIRSGPSSRQLALHTLTHNGLAGPVIIIHGNRRTLHRVFNPSPLPYIMLLSLGLPGVSNLRILHRVHRARTAHRLPIIVLASSDRRHSVVRDCRLNTGDCIHGPISVSRFARTIHRLNLC